MAHANEELLRQGYEAFSKGDMEALAALFAHDVVWHTPGRGMTRIRILEPDSLRARRNEESSQLRPDLGLSFVVKRRAMPRS
jgi:ketosteroid isomerase-like protein